MPSTQAIIEATPEDQAAIAPMLARAFQDDPVFLWMIPDPATRLARMERLFNLLFRLETKLGGILKAEDDHCASFWRPPGAAVTPFTAFVLNVPVLLQVFGLHLGRSLAVSDAIEAHLPKERAFLYAHFVGVDPSVQRQGRGAAMMRTGLRALGPAGFPSTLRRPGSRMSASIYRWALR